MKEELRKTVKRHAAEDNGVETSRAGFVAKCLPLLMAAALTVSAASCKKGTDSPASPAHGRGFSAVTESHTSDDKTALEGDGVVKWTANDAIAVFDGSAAAPNRFYITEYNGTKATFVCDEGYNADAAHYAIYPYGNIHQTSGTFSGLKLLATQTYRDGTFGDDVNLMAAYAGEGAEELQFKNLCGVLKLTLKGITPVKSIKVEANGDNEWLSGDASVSFSESGVPTLGQATDGNQSKSVTLECDGVELTKDGVPFYIVLPPCDMSKGFTVTVENMDGNTILNRTAPHSEHNVIEASYMTKMPAMVAGNDLSKGGRESANCYITSKKGSYMFLATMRGNGVEPNGTTAAAIAPKSAKVLWETNNGQGTVSHVIEKVELVDNKYVCFNTTGTPGNASIAVYNSEDPSSGEILWSWHIWCVDENEVPDVCRNAKDGQVLLMDRNLGALSSDASSGNASYGLMYQWGRKDPFMGSADRTGTALMAYTPSNAFPDAVPGSTIEGAILAPTTFVTRANASTNDWLSTPNDKLWSSTDGKKTMYDPCPYNWRVPIGGSSDKNPWGQKSGGYNNTQGTNYVWTWNSSGHYATLNGASTGSVDSQFPASGGRSSSDGTLNDVGSNGYYWSATPSSNDAYSLSFFSSNVNPSNSSRRALGFCVRPVQESSSSSK